MQVSATIALWIEWFRCVQLLRPACSRQATFKWLCIALAGFTVRGDIAGVTSFVRALGLKEAAYCSLLDLFHTPALDLTKLTHPNDSALPQYEAYPAPSTDLRVRNTLFRTPSMVEAIASGRKSKFTGRIPKVTVEVR